MRTSSPCLCPGSRKLTSTENRRTVLSYAVEVLGVKHIIVMGHYGCGGVAAAIMTPSMNPVEKDSHIQSWIRPIRALYRNTTRYVVTLSEC